MRAEKQLLLDEIKDQIDQNDSFLIMQYSSLKADLAQSLREEIAKMGGFVEIVRKRILVKAAEDAGIDLSVKDLPGHIGIIFSGQDAIETTKATFQFAKDNGKVLEVLGGRFEGKLYGAADMEKLSQLPSMDQMRAQFLGLLEAPMSQTVGVMNSLLCSVLYCLEQKVQKENS